MRFAAGLAVALLLAGCALEPARNANLPVVGVAFQWTAADRCSPRSPALTIQNLPPGTARVAVRLTDLNMPMFNQGGEIFVPPGGRVPPGTLPNYAGPCPPAGERHSFRFTVEARDAAGQVIGAGQATQLFPPE
ncbi:hypothetical protein [Roseococcus sp. SYP-B2431]|uniref:hypothetical protein n=1 Tax=Roseococcus sp. SYP-B2431 TaxID=2496640 RepID=UPI0013F47E9C|nr:hypothetical protein [Roseococcus sp. SYP-B2431]